MDNGGELANDEMRQLGNQYGKNIKSTAQSPWSSGLYERNRAIINMMKTNLPNADENTALQYAVSARNCCFYVRAFTPAQLATEQNPKLPPTFHDQHKIFVPA